ncbi:hypothetical protein [Kineococcus rhizosphaerae]|uniref:LemA protein n=1 Tax=Kineococcus rhizosphaerae TaxID=559628 RepID=A0A2T0R9M2_9ACTN|nr:hypothetical protein [Kineococcus rhizosphaerae]PRY17865.1 hypothetical protein CLV37_101107 [Kineococcus rhizosphaerae]
MTALVQGLVALLVLAAVAWYLSATAQRVDRLHRRVETSRAALDAELTRRASAALEYATSGELDPASSLLLADAATTSLDAPRTPAALREANDADDAHRWRVESDLTRALAAALPASDGPGLARVQDAGHRVELARRFHNDAVVQTRRLRGKRIVRWAHLAGRARVPETADFLDDLRPGGPT